MGRNGRHSTSHEERIAELIAMLPPAPDPWVEAAKELPRTRRGLEQLLVLAEADAGFRDELVADLESALRAKGIEPRPDLLGDLRNRLAEAGDEGS